MTKANVRTRAMFLMLAGIIGWNSRGIFIQGNFAGRHTGQTITMQQKQQTDATTERLKVFYMTQCDRLWENLAHYQAEATIKGSRKHAVDLSVLVGVVIGESTGYPFARNRITGATGAGQIDFKAHKERFPHIVRECDKYDPLKNIDCAAEMLSGYIKEYGLRDALQVYNLGESGASQPGIRQEGHEICKALPAVLIYSKKSI